MMFIVKFRSKLIQSLQIELKKLAINIKGLNKTNLEIMIRKYYALTNIYYYIFQKYIKCKSFDSALITISK